jgi:hypothetical protein
LIREKHFSKIQQTRLKSCQISNILQLYLIPAKLSHTCPAILAEQTNAVKWAFHVSNIFFAS